MFLFKKSRLDQNFLNKMSEFWICFIQKEFLQVIRSGHPLSFALAESDENYHLKQYAYSEN